MEIILRLWRGLKNSRSMADSNPYDIQWIKLGRDRKKVKVARKGNS